MHRIPTIFILLVLTLGATTLVSADDVPNFASICGGITAENPTPSQACLALMTEYRHPPYPLVARDDQTMNTYNYYQVTAENPALYGSPGGAVVGNMGAGFNYVRAVDTSVPGWVQAESGNWMRLEDLRQAPASELRGIRLRDGVLHNDVAWILGTLQLSPYPGGPHTGRMVYRNNTVSIFATVEVDGWNWYMVGPNEWIEQRHVAKTTLVDRPAEVSGRWVAVDLYEQTLVAYEDDNPVFATMIASGLPGWDTNQGVFTVWLRYASASMSGAFGAPDAYALDSVPWTMYFDNDIALHGAYWHDGFGLRRSHGCVNMSISDSRWVYEWSLGADGPLDEEGRLQTFVVVHSSGEYR